ncbi:hypothetical protein FRC09_019069 [Ceratobasidium sp. 395]|nr:hypothetical protein FRC09_019069 [Ceratobasidium sp. 395]
MAGLHSHITELHYFSISFQDSLPLLHRVTIQSGSDRSSAIPNDFSHGASRPVGLFDADPSRRDTMRPFPSLAELLELTVIKSLLAKNISAYRFEEMLQDHGDQIQSEIEEWEVGVEQKLVDILKSGQDALTAKPGLTSEATSQTSVTKTQNPLHFLNIRPPGSLDDTTIPKSTIMFPSPVHLGCTTDTSRLRETTKILLRADSRFIRKGGSLCYPMVCSSQDKKPPFSAENINSYGVRWDHDPIAFDGQGTLICRRLLADLGRPNATHAELSIIGNNFKCGRCSFPPTIWEVVVGHYREELDRWEQVESARKKDQSLIPYNNLHDLAPDEHKPLVYMVSPKDAHETLKLNYALGVDRRFCGLCSHLGLDPRSYRLVAGDDSCALSRHLQDV